MSQFDQLVQVIFEGQRPSPLHQLAVLAELMAENRESWWRWTCYLAVAIAARKTGIVPQ